MGIGKTFIIGFNTVAERWEFLSEMIDSDDKVSLSQLRKAFEAIRLSEKPYIQLKICETIYG